MSAHTVMTGEGCPLPHVAHLRGLAWLGGRRLVGLWGHPNPLTPALRCLLHLHRRIPVLDVAGPHLPPAFPVLWPREFPEVCGYPLFWADPWEQKVLRPLPHSPAIPELGPTGSWGRDGPWVLGHRQEPEVSLSTSVLSPRFLGCTGLGCPALFWGALSVLGQLIPEAGGPGPLPGLPHMGLRGNQLG